MKDQEKQIPANQRAATDTGNASNPPAEQDTPGGPRQLIDEKGEKYLREVANIEDEPDARDQQKLDDLAKREKNRSSS